MGAGLQRHWAHQYLVHQWQNPGRQELSSQPVSVQMSHFKTNRSVQKAMIIGIIPCAMASAACAHLGRHPKKPWPSATPDAWSPSQCKPPSVRLGPSSPLGGGGAGGPLDVELETDGSIGSPARLPKAPTVHRPPTQIALSWPLPATGVTSLFGPRQDPIDGRTRIHYGLDLEAPYGAVVSAVAAGRVVAAGRNGDHGRQVILDHGFGYSTSYSHLANILVQADTIVQAGHPIGMVGNSGRSTGPHLHLELRRYGRAMDPLDSLGGSVPID